MTDTIIRTSGDYTLSLNGGAATVAARNYHLVHVVGSTVTSASLTLLPGEWVATASQSEQGRSPGGALCALVQHVANIHGPLRVADDGSVPGILEGIVLVDEAGNVSYGPPEARDQDITHHRIR